MSPPPVGRVLPGAPVCEGLSGPAVERQFLAGTVARAVRSALDAAGLAPEGPPDAETLLVEPGAVPAAAAVRSALAAGRARGRDCRLVPASAGAAPMIAVAPPAPGLVWLAPGGRPDHAARAAAAEPVEIDAEERAFEGFPLPGGQLVVADAYVLPVRHWVQLLWANLLALGPFLWAELVGHGAGAAARLAWAVARAGSRRPEAVAAALTRRGARTSVHRAATVEASWLGDGAKVGAGAVVRGAVLGPGAVVEEQAVVEGVVLGEGARVQRLAMAKFSVVEAGACLGGIAQLAVLGPRSQVKHGATLMDVAFGQDVRVRRGEALVPAPHGLVGVCVDADAVLGSGVRVAPGRAVPAGLVVLPDPSEVLSRPDAPPGARKVVVRNGGLEPVG